ncbi:MAG: hypothetical protein J6M17_00125 [Ruminococcus sp.]|nr:hypothetical protein [Ruminococcus sp.]
MYNRDEDRPETVEEFRNRRKNREGLFSRYGLTEKEKQEYRHSTFLFSTRAGRRYVRSQESIEFVMRWWPAALMGLGGIAVCRLLKLAMEYYLFGFLIGCVIGIFIKYFAFDNFPADEALRKSIVPSAVTLLLTIILAVIFKTQL